MELSGALWGELSGTLRTVKPSRSTWRQVKGKQFRENAPPGKPRQVKGTIQQQKNTRHKNELVLPYQILGYGQRSIAVLFVPGPIRCFYWNPTFIFVGFTVLRCCVGRPFVPRFCIVGRPILLCRVPRQCRVVRPVLVYRGVPGALCGCIVCSGLFCRASCVFCVVCPFAALRFSQLLWDALRYYVGRCAFTSIILFLSLVCRASCVVFITTRVYRKTLLCLFLVVSNAIKFLLKSYCFFALFCWEFFVVSIGVRLFFRFVVSGVLCSFYLGLLVASHRCVGRSF